MPETSTRRVNITFDDALPAGAIGRFTLDKQPWICLPRSKYQRILACIDRMLAHNNRIRRQMVRWINQWPGDSVRVAEALITIEAIGVLVDETIVEKTEASTM